MLNNLPHAISSFIGRETERDEVEKHLSKNRLVSLIGGGGFGKTRLAIEVGKEVLTGYPDGVGFVTLAALHEPHLISQLLASVLGLREEPGRAVITSICEYLTSRRLLLLLDNCEHMLSACASLSETILSKCPKSKY